MTSRLLCLDTSVLISYLTPEDLHEPALRLVEDALVSDSRLVAPTWAWAEVGSVLRKKVRSAAVREDEAQEYWKLFLDLPIRFLDADDIRRRSWELAKAYGLPTLYDATFLACTELADADETLEREFWTADVDLLQQLGPERPAYVRSLSA